MSDTPYHGLRPFNRDETDIFFGREQHTDELIERLGKQNFLAVVGYSGCGKSSLVRAGLIPSLQAGFLANAGTHWRIAECRPGNQPFINLAQALAEEEALGADYHTALIDNQILTRGSLSLHELLAIKPLPHNAKLLIVCDQFEEIFRYYKQGVKTEAETFVKLLLASCLPYRLQDGTQSQDVYVILTMRSDFLGDCALFSGLTEKINNGLYLTPRLNRDQLREAIEEPAFVFGREIEPQLVIQLLEDAQHNPDQLPLLQHLLMRMWQQAEQADSLTLDLALYQNLKIESLEKALSIHADEIYYSLTIEQQKIAEVLFRNLAIIENNSDTQGLDIRNPIQLSSVAELAGVSCQQVIPIINAFRQPMCNFLTPVLPIKLTADSLIDISHESFIRHWHRLQVWLKDELKSVKNYRRLREWALLNLQNRAGFLTQPELGIYLKWYQQQKPNAIWAARYSGAFEVTEQFLLASKKHYYRRKTGLIGLVIMAMITFAIAFQHQKQQTHQISQSKKEVEQSLEVLYGMKDAFLTKDNSPKLEKMFFRLTKENALNSNAWVYYAHALTHQNKLNKAVDAYRSAIKINANNSSAWEGLAAILNQQESWNKADDLFPVELEESILSLINKKIIASTVGEEESDKIIDSFKQQKILSLAKYGLMKSNKTDEELEFYLKLVKLNPKSVWAWKFFGQVLKEKRKLKEAIDVYQQATKLAPYEQSLSSNDNAWGYLINTLIAANKIEEAVKTSQEALTLNPDKSWAWNNLGRTLFKQKQYQQAETIYKEALIKFPDNLNLLKGDLKLALSQKNKTRFQQHLKAIQPLLMTEEPYYALVTFLVFLVEAEADYQAVLNAINKTPRKLDFHWDFKSLNFIIQQQDDKKQQQIKWFIDYFNGNINSNFLLEQFVATHLKDEKVAH